ncbi:MAG TPA: PPC domain-containing protein, partial [Gemmataceae bacterium]|nr:PPC domain-containing protein [Gemmataceae bacterium]
MRWKHLGTAVVVSMAFLAGRAGAQTDSQLPNPQLSTLMPCGGRAGSAVTVTFTGTDLEEPQALRFSHPGIQATPIVPPKPKADPKKPPPPQPPVTQFTVHIDPHTPPGFYDVRLVNRWGVSNPRTFVVGDLNEVAEKEPNDTEKQRQRVTLNTTVTGAIAAPTDVDYYVFAGKKGQRVLISCLASSIDSRLEPEIRLYDSNNKQLALARDYKGTDALADCILPADGDYTVRVCSFTYTEGSPEHFYRLSITTAPWIDAIHPCVVEPGKPTHVTVYGRNLPGGTLDPTVKVRGNVLERLSVTVTPPADPQARHHLTYSGNADPRMASLDAFEYRVRNGAGVSNPFLLALAHAPVVSATGKQNTPQTAQPVQIPCEVAGRVLTRNEGDWFSFTAHKGETIAIDVTSDRLGSQADMYFLLRNAANHQDIAEVDAHTEALTNNLKFYQATEDPGTYLFTVPADGRYELLIGSRYAGSVFGIRHYYCLRLTRPEPDFHLVVLPAADSRPDAGQLLQNGQQLFTVLAWRHDGWDGPINLSVDGLPQAVTCQPQMLAAGLRQTSLVLSAAPNAAAWTGDIHVKGTATINAKTITHEARPGGITWPVQPGSGIPAVARLDRSLALAVRDKAP